MAIVMKNVTDDDRKRNKDLPPMKEHETKYPKRAAGSAAEARQAFRDWQKQQKSPEPAKNPEVKIAAVPPSAANIAKLAAISESSSPTAEIVSQKLDEQTLFGTLFSTLSIYEYMRMEGEYKKRKASSRNAATADREWAQVVEGAKSAFGAAGLKVTDAQLSKWSKDLAANKRNLEATAKIANSRAAGAAPAASRMPSGAQADFGTLIGSFVNVTATFIDPNIITNYIANLCSQPFTQGTFTKHWSNSWNLTVSIPYWCPTWSNPFRTCTTTATLAGVSVDVGLNVGYKVSCCGASAWGQASAQACGTILGITKCVSCTATVVGVAGFSRVAVTPSQCSYGLGINAGVSCNVFGATVFSATWSFGYTVTGPCPPPGFC